MPIGFSTGELYVPSNEGYLPKVVLLLPLNNQHSPFKEQVNCAKLTYPATLGSRIRPIHQASLRSCVLRRPLESPV